MNMPQKTEIEWFGISEGLPVIPEGRYAVKILVMVFDSSLEKCFPGSGHNVLEAMYGCTTNKEGKKCGAWTNSELLFDFQTLEPGVFPDSDWMPIIDRVVAWAYWPEGPKGLYVKQKNERGHKLYETGEEDAPDAILDSNGEVVLSLCRVCGGAEGCLPTHCPNRQLTAYELDQISQGELDF